MSENLEPLNILVFLGSVRTSTPPRPARLGERVSLFCRDLLMAAGHNVMLIDPLVDMPHPAPAEFKPHFAYANGKAPPKLDALADKIRSADGYVMVSPEYNHSMSPALAGMLNHFGSSLYSWKPSAIVTYSAGQWGGARAGVNMRTYLSELGCLPVSAMVHVPKAQGVFTESGKLSGAQNSASWKSYCSRAMDQLAWWANASRSYRENNDPEQVVPAFVSDPSQRDAGNDSA
ncbi:NADPH-dependent FMN reductase [Phaeobacter sp. 11ANDIMAR09]|uniref:NADPH-dependent FMN reductase n=1 Tax=Phaeobacter sp. 11ANDIMAR09 TaxID=1225647 RepID=UPI0006C84598|nr:NAD(P)H-dependent oxidoreductase [Phaeobacter sp. 11ANDIMAR09]KPD10300.1 flavoprotein [Phaeobacter sp. 11ANDIMAR09]